MAVRLDIRPRLRLAPDWQPGPVTRRRWLPPLAAPALAYWAGMAALTYGFTQLGPHPLDAVFRAEPSPAVSPPAAPAEEPPALLEPAREPVREKTTEPGPLAEAPRAEEAPSPEREESLEALRTSPLASPREPRSRGEARGL
ncbi:MAG: hypothetical protein EOO73_36315, partial [Myxococcales bacterium]